MYCIYLRKSRADAEAEAKGEGETLARHEKILLDLAKRYNLAIGKIYREIVSGDTIAARPVMQQLLSDVEEKTWEGVLVVEVERLARGDTIDQGVVSQSFKYSGTKIITPVKTYDPNNEFDEEYFEFGLFMARREYKTINRRLQRGRIESIKEGKYVANKAPYGYKRIRIPNDKGFTLEIIPDEAETVKMIFELYTVGELLPDGKRKRVGVSLIARRLNNMGISSSSGGVWTVSTVRDMLINPVYAGKIRWNWRAEKKTFSDGKVKKSRPRTTTDKCMLVEGLHPAIISDETFSLAQELIQTNRPRPIGEQSTIQNPLSGLVVCGICGRKMVRRPYSSDQDDTLMCPETTCSNVSSKLKFVERRILLCLQEWVNDYYAKSSQSNTADTFSSDQLCKDLKRAEKSLTSIKGQLEKTYDLLEQGVYTTDVFAQRSKTLSERIKSQEGVIKSLKENIIKAEKARKSREVFIPKVQHLLETYTADLDAGTKNELLSEVIEKAVYTKEKGTRWQGSPDDFQVFVFPKLTV